MIPNVRIKHFDSKAEGSLYCFPFKAKFLSASHPTRLFKEYLVTNNTEWNHKTASENNIKFFSLKQFRAFVSQQPKLNLLTLLWIEIFSGVDASKEKLSLCFYFMCVVTINLFEELGRKLFKSYRVSLTQFSRIAIPIFLFASFVYESRRVLRVSLLISAAKMFMFQKNFTTSDYF